MTAELELSYLLEKGDMGDRLLNNRWKNITQEQALFIKQLRVLEGHSWRSVARCFMHEYKLNDSVSQLTGILLCEAARHILKEDVERGWN